MVDSVLEVQNIKTTGSPQKDIVTTDSGTGDVTVKGNVVIPDNGTIGSESDTNAITIDASGNVGIGTTSPSAKLEIAENNDGTTTATAVNRLRFTDTDTTSTGGPLNQPLGVIEFASADISDPGVGARVSAVCTYGGSVATDLTFETGTPSAIAERMRIDSNGVVTITGTYAVAKIEGSTNASLFLIDTGAATGLKNFQIFTVNGRLEFNAVADDFLSDTTRLTIDSSGALILAGSTAQKASGTTWTNPSDIRLKENISNYSKGISELIQIQVKQWEYNGKAGTVLGQTGLGVIADEIESVLPNTVDTYSAKLNEDDETETDIKKFDATEITWLLVNTCKEQQALIESQQSQIDALTARIEVLENAAG